MSTEAEELLRRARSEVRVGEPPVVQVLGVARRQRRQHAVVIGSSAAVVGVLVVSTVLAVRGPGDSVAVDVPSRVEVTPEANPLDVPWASGDELHLLAGVARVSDGKPENRVAGLVAVAGGAVYVTEGRTRGGVVVLVNDSGEQSVIGHHVSAGQIAGDESSGIVSWVEDAGRPEVVAYDAGERREVARVPMAADGPRHEWLDEGPAPIAVHGRMVWFAGWDADYKWQVDGRPEVWRRGDGRVLDVHGKSVVFRWPGGGASYCLVSCIDPSPLPGDRGQLSPDGARLAATTDTGVEVVSNDAVPLTLQVPAETSAADWWVRWPADGRVLVVTPTKVPVLENNDGIALPVRPPYTVFGCDPDGGTCRALVTGLPDVILPG